EPGAEPAVLLEPSPQPVEAFGHLLAGGVGEGLCPLVHLDTGDDSLRLEQFWKRRAVVRRLPDRLVEQDYAPDVLLDPLGREEQLPVCAPVLLSRLDADRVEALLDRSVGLVGREDPLPVGDDPDRSLVQLVLGHPFLRRFDRRKVSLRIRGYGGASLRRRPLLRVRSLRAAAPDSRRDPKGVAARFLPHVLQDAAAGGCLLTRSGDFGTGRVRK